MIKSLRDSPGSLCLAASIVIAWSVSACVLGQSPFASQRSGLLLEIGAVNGEALATQQWWRLVTSQFLHVQLMHMLFNAICIWIVGGFIERASSVWRVWWIYLVGGGTGVVASVMSYPVLVSSGASQALMALCGATLVLVPRRDPRTFVLFVVATQVALDLYTAQKIKAGHAGGFVAGVVIGALVCFAGAGRRAGYEEERLR